MTNPSDGYSNFVWPYGPMCFLPASFETDAVPASTLRYLKEHGLPRYTPLYTRFDPLENGLQKQEELSEKVGRDFFVIGRASPSCFGLTWNFVDEMQKIPSHAVVCIDLEGKVYDYEHHDNPEFYVGPGLLASSVERLYARVVVETQEFACLEPDRAEVIKNAPESGDGFSAVSVYVDQVVDKLRAVDPDAPIDDPFDDIDGEEGRGLFWSEGLWEEASSVGAWYSKPPEEW